MDSLNATVSASLGAFQSALRVGNSVISGVGDGGVGNDVTESEMEGTTLLMPPWGYAVSAITLFFIGFFGFLFNLIVIVLMCKDVQLWTPINIILLNQVCSDFSVSIFGNPFTFAAAINRNWIFGESLCVFYGFFMSLFGITSITTLTVLSYLRYCLICRPLSTRQADNKGSYSTVLLIWTYSLLLTTPPLLGWGQYVIEPPNISCSVNWNSHTPNATSYIIYLFIFGLIVPLTVILHSYINIIRTMKRSSIRLGRVNKAESKVTVMVGMMIVLFMVAWTPYSIFALMEQFGPGVNPALAVLPALIAKSSICYNPVIYVAMNSQYRAAWTRFWSGTDEDGVIQSSLDTTVNKISSKLSTELEILRKRQNRGPNLTVVEEVSVTEHSLNSAKFVGGVGGVGGETNNNKTSDDQTTAASTKTAPESGDKGENGKCPEMPPQRPRQLLVSLDTNGDGESQAVLV